MKKVIPLLFSLLFTFLLIPGAYAHQGGTDSSGGHIDRSTGEYHYHHGYSAHQHKDLDGDGDLDCPHDFKDKTGHNSGNSTYRSSYSYPSYTPEPVPLPTEKPKKEFDPSNNLFFIAGVILFSVGLMFLPVLVSELKTRREPKVVKTEHVVKPSDIQTTQITEREKFLAEKAEYTEKYGGKPLLELAGAPSNCYIADDGFPAAFGSERWGDGYTFYITYSGRAYHKSTCRYGRGCIPENAYYLSVCSDKHPCSYCRPELPDLSWYQEYLKIKAIKEKYKIE